MQTSGVKFRMVFHDANFNGGQYLNVRLSVYSSAVKPLLAVCEPEMNAMVGWRKPIA